MVIFGGSRGLGLAMAARFSSAGAHVVLTARDEQELERAAADIDEQGGQVTTIACDITDREQIERTVAAASSTTGAASTCSSTTPASSRSGRSST